MPRTPCLLVAAALAGVLPAGAGRAELIANGSVEQVSGERPAGWATDVREGEHRFFVSDEAHSGKHCLAIASEAPGWARWYTTDLVLLAGARYRLTAWVRTSGEAPVGEVWMPHPTATQYVRFEATPEWTCFTREFVAPETGRQGLYLQSRGTGTVFFDDLSLEQLEGPKLEGTGTIACVEGAPLAGIVTAGDGGPHEGYLALDAREVLEKMTGVALPVVSLGGEDAARGRWLHIGCAPDRAAYDDALSRVGKEGIVLDVTPRAVVCLGNTPRGVYYAVQELYYRLGCRWYMPFDGGACIPKADRLALPEGRIVHRPSFDLRGAKTIQVYHYPPEMEARHVDTEAWVDWAARNHMNGLKASYPQTWQYGAVRGGQWTEYSGHTLYSILPPEKHFAEHPEYFPLVHGGRTHLHSSGRPAELCVSNPDLPAIFARRISGFFDTEPDGERFGVCAEDEPSYWCECEACRVLDTDPELDWSRNGEGTMNLTDRWMYFVNAIAELVAKRHPDKPIATFAYASTRQPPRRYLPRENVQIELTWWSRCFRHAIGDPRCEVNAEGMKLFRAWRELAPICIYGYLHYRYMEAPTPYYHSEADFLRTMHREGVRHISDEWDTTHLSSPLFLNLRARLLWDVDTDVDVFIRDFCRAVYGPAAEPMREYFLTLERSTEATPSEHVRFNDLAQFTPEVMARCHELLSRAERLAGEDEVLQARIARLRVSLLYTQVCMTLPLAEKEPKLWARVLTWRDQVQELVQRHKIPIVLMAYNVLDPGYRPPVEALSGRKVMKLAEEWRFRADPEAVGEKERWFAAEDLTAWEPIRVTAAWEGQGHPGYDGDAWYAVRVTLPDAGAARAYLLFEAVDETYKLWINGEYVGESSGDPGVLWDKPQAAEVTGRYRAGQENLLVVKVHDIGYAGGLWKPVWLVAGE